MRECELAATEENLQGVLYADDTWVDTSLRTQKYHRESAPPRIPFFGLGGLNSSLTVDGEEGLYRPDRVIKGGINPSNLPEVNKCAVKFYSAIRTILKPGGAIPDITIALRNETVSDEE